MSRMCRMNSIVLLLLFPFITRAQQIQDTGVAVSEYVNNILLTLPEDQLLSRHNIELISKSVRSSRENGFTFLYAKADKINVAVGIPQYAQLFTDAIIEKEEITEKIKKGVVQTDGKPNWRKFRRQIRNKYSVEDADRIILSARIKWLEEKKMWPQYCQLIIKKVNVYGPYEKRFPTIPFPEEWKWNVVAWDLFVNATDKNVLLKALSWSERSLKMSNFANPGFIDTYANLLYKLGRVKEALQWQEKAVALSPGANEIQENMLKMQRNERTWPDQQQ